ncbi:hypothetical protein [Microbulbifer sp. 2205BS26-8]|uniref:hypothetical protein n=1 Tax=Microbulbifer sp. 2205BS26-8 TaxID=3064386 RepID=UPI00273F6A4F|nr:hypothetical protein [Microbulbifer sp. 2205BS26-8]MDP5210834.1 hypothetical protein [Microbulbifer sp. 2205BS26-8]
MTCWLRRFFTGYVVHCTEVDNSRQKLYCRELSVALAQRYVTLAAVRCCAL